MLMWGRPPSAVRPRSREAAKKCSPGRKPWVFFEGGKRAL